MILSIDPGRKPAYTLLDESQLVERKHLPYRPRLPLVVLVALKWTDFVGAWWKLSGATPASFKGIDRVVVEGQHGKLDRKKKRSILTLANEAGWQLHRACTTLDARPVIIHPQALTKTDRIGWRDALECPGISKQVMQNRVERSLLPIELSLFACASAARLGDCFDAAAVGWGAWKADTKDWSPPP